MDFIIEDGYQVKWGMHAEYQQWVSANTDALRRAQPDGIEYIGTYVTVYGNDYLGGTFRDLRQGFEKIERRTTSLGGLGVIRRAYVALREGVRHAPISTCSGAIRCVSGSAPDSRRSPSPRRHRTSMRPVC